ncbi:MAG: hypothetical protein V2I24_03850 [Halieaceae bacterium]|jgi:hypothetical protein|nr:hypothetical protein [Halieaceae bacterium]
MPRGGARPRAGRPPGAKNKATRAREKAITESGLSPLEYLIQVYRDEAEDTGKRLDAAKAAAPYLHPRLSSVQVSGDLTINHEQALKELE